MLARAGLRRLGRDEGGVVLDAPVFVPAAGPGRAGAAGPDGRRRRARRGGRRWPTTGALACLLAERAACRVLGAYCHTPVGIHADGRRMRGFVGAPDGSAWVLDELEGLDGEALARRMLAAGARRCCLEAA